MTDAFSKNHTYPYSVIGFQEATIFYKYPEIIWNCSCLSVNSGAIDTVDEDAKEKGTDYGKIASAIGKIQKQGVIVNPPYINEAEFSFTPDLESDEVIYGLKGLTGLNKEDDIKYIIKNAPYKSFKDFYERCNLVKIEKTTASGELKIASAISNKQCEYLIKAGAFDKLEKDKDRIQLLEEFLILSKTKKGCSNGFKKCTLTNITDIENILEIPDEYQDIIKISKFRDYVSKKCDNIKHNGKVKYIIFQHKNPKVQERIDSVLEDYFLGEMNEDYYELREDGIYIINTASKAKGSYTRIFEDMKKPLVKWLSSDEVKEQYFNYQKERFWYEMTEGVINISKWEMESLNFYFHEHELNHIDKNRYGFVNFYDLDEEPTRINPIEEKYAKYDLFKIIGTVIDKDKTRKTLSVLTPDGVVSCKIGGKYHFYDKTISRDVPDPKKKGGTKSETIEESWFKRGTHLMLMGFRSGDDFIVRKDYGGVDTHSIKRISKYKEDGTLILITERQFA